MFVNLLSRFGIDKAIFYVLLSRGAGSISGFITLLLISRFLTPIEQGYYYTFASILGLQVIFELGFGSVLVQFVSHEMVGIIINKNGATGSEPHLSRLFFIVNLAVKWYLVVSAAVLVIIFPLGYLFFSDAPADGLLTEQWLFPWFFLVLSASLSLIVTPILSIAEGCGFVSDVARLRFFQTLISAFTAWLFLLSGHGMYAAGATSIAIFVVGCIWIKLVFFPVIKQSLKHPRSDKYADFWKKEILPVQWRIGVSWLCGYFIFQLFNPVAFRFFGAKFAGQLGLSLSVVSLMSTIALSWVMTKVPRFGFLIANNSRDELDSLYKDTFKNSLLFLCLEISVAIGAVFVLNELGLLLAERFVQPVLFILLCLTVVGSHIVACQATYVRAHKIERYLGNAISTAVLMSLLLFVSKFLGGNYVVIFYCGVVWLFSVPHSSLIFKRFKRQFC